MQYLSNKILEIDLQSNKFNEEFVSEEVIRKYVGGCALGAKFLYEKVPPTIEWSDAKNCLIILGGQLTGTKIPGSGGFSVSTKGAMTNCAASTQAQGVFCAYLRKCGFWGLVIYGISKYSCYLIINEDGKPELRNAGHLIGKDTWETYDLIVNENEFKNRKISILTLGPAGENLVRYACICADKGHIPCFFN